MSARLDWLYGRQKIGIKLGLENMKKLLGKLGEPGQKIPTIHVAGTNGKGSTCALLAQAIQNSGKVVGLYTSPHLLAFGERIRVNGVNCNATEVEALLEQIQPLVEALDSENVKCTFFEIVTAMAFVHFASSKCDVLVLETGMGGRFDATNVCLPMLSIVTNVGEDHMAFLGNTIREIAFEKAGIIKAGVPCITAAKGDALEVIQVQSASLGSKLIVIGEEYQGYRRGEEVMIVHPFGEASLPLKMRGEHQIENALLVLSAANELTHLGMTVSLRNVASAFASVEVPGRLQSVISSGVEILLDGAHNLDGAIALRNALVELDFQPYHLVFGAMHDKKWREILDQVCPLALKVHAVEAINPRRQDAGNIVEAANLAGHPATAYPNVADGLAQATREARADGARVLVCGSLFVIAEALAALAGVEGEIRGSQ